MANQDASYKEKLQSLRRLMGEQGVEGFLIPRADEYQGEFVAAYAERLKWLSGFSGSAGVAIVLEDKAVVLTDGRYTLQAPQQVDGDIWSVADSAKVSTGKWIVENLPSGVIGYDPWLHTPKQIEAIEADIEGKNIKLKPIENLVDAVWTDQPERPLGSVVSFPEKFAGMSAADKCVMLVDVMKEKNLEACVITLPDSIAWLLNIRGSDVNYTPLALSYLALNSRGRVSWFVEPDKVPVAVRNALGDGVQIIPPSVMNNAFENYRGISVGLDFKRSPLWFKAALEAAGVRVNDFKDPAIEPKARKSAAEQEAVKQAHIRDGVALVNMLCWLDEAAPKGALSELDIAAKLEECRGAFPEYRGPSFPTIAGFGANGAIVHYRATKATHAQIIPPGFLLVDSGGQYIDGTTDITRTVVVENISDDMKRHFTLVLKGHIAVASARFKKGTLGKEIDALARAPLLEEGLNFAHGTGHGVGCYLGVHEEAANLSPKGEAALEPGMLLSNEPGYYQEGSHGIRIENLVLVQGDEEEMLFETVSFAPIDIRAIDAGLMSAAEIEWLNLYHRQVFETLGPLLEKNEKQWLSQKTQPLC